MLLLDAKGGAGTASLLLKAQGTNLPPLALPLDQDPSVTVQLQQSGGVCWEATFAAPPARNDATQFKDSPR